MAIWNTSLNKYCELVESPHLLISLAYMASGVQFLALTVAVGACPLELLHKTWSQSFSLSNLSLAITVLANMNIFGVVSTRTPAMRANRHLIVSYL